MDADESMDVSDSDASSVDSDDAVLAEYPVFLSRDLGDAIHLLQFPLGHAPETTQTHPLSGKLKPKSKQLELHVPLDTGDSHYDQDRGAMMATIATKGAKSAGGHDDDVQPDFGTKKVLEKQTLVSSLVPSVANYCVGAFSEGALHLHPISTLLQLRPSLAHLIPPSADAPAPSNPHVLGAGPAPKKAGEVDKAAMAREMARNAASRKAREEEWVPLEVEGAELSTLLTHLIHPPLAPSAAPVSPTSYLDDLSPVVRDRPKNAELRVFRGMALADVAGADVGIQIRVVMTNAHILPLSRLLSHLVPPPSHPTPHITATQALPHLKPLCHIVRGLLVLKSPVLYSGRPMHARNILLGFFRESPVVHRAELCDQTAIGAAEARGMLGEIAVYVPGEGDTPGQWELRYPDDDGFAEWPEEAADLERILDEEIEASRQDLLLRVSDAKAKSKTKVEPGAKRQVGMKAEPITTVVINADVNVNADDILAFDGSPFADPRDFHVQGATKDDQIAHLCKQVLMVYGPCTLRFLRSCVAWRGAKEPKLQHNKITPTPPSVEHLTVLLAPFTEVIHSTYVLATSEHSKLSTSLGAYRDAVLALFRKAPGVKKQEVNTECENRGLDPMGSSTYKKVLSEFANFESAKWMWKRGEHKVPP
ncbi:hypothetical protein M427DRAFT_274537 [Gonapodya prolifera JEL478]|uniref:Uncharacterized protein n=1 Tax=Gonapodya prolifera (strain JEL478) TaxID=1344416 RepID=A0A139AY27_GONPJ|nr:hypothetical protein M427DRAFT_274537 [Gonapodya prolifera JEL478]|eukprot:KXS21604.1 hypothetical protein M427DRAFT_274537 [Gonapodya prolifera JEL478]